MKKRMLAMLLCVGMLLSGISLSNCWKGTSDSLFATAYAAGLVVKNLGDGKVECAVSNTGGFFELYVNGVLKASGSEEKTVTVSAKAGDMIKIMTLNGGSVEKVVAPVAAETPTEAPESSAPTVAPTLSPEDPPEFWIGSSYYNPALPGESFTIHLKIANEVLPLKSLHVTVSTVDGAILYESNGTSFRSVDLTVDEACVLKVSIEAVDAEGRYAESKDNILCVCPDHAKPVQVGFVEDDDLTYSITDHAHHEISGTMQIDTNCANCGYQHAAYSNWVESENHNFVDGYCACGLDETDFEFNITNGAVKITGYLGSDADIVIPESIAGCPVTVLGENSFSKIHSMKSVTIPASVSSIGRGAFYVCQGLLDFKLSPESNFFRVQDGVLFSGDGSKLLYYPAGKSGDYSVPEGVTSIGQYAFSGCEGLKRIQLPEGLISIEELAICYSSIESIYIPDSVTYIHPQGIYSISPTVVEVGVDSYAHTWCMNNDVKHTTDGLDLCTCATPIPTPTPAVTPAPTASLTVKNLGNGKVACTVSGAGGFFEIYVSGKLVASGAEEKTVTVSAKPGDTIRLESMSGACVAIVSTHGHVQPTLENIIEFKAASCTKDGSITFYCVACKANVREVFKAYEHTNSLIEIVDPTCTKAGYDEYQCTNCLEVSRTTIAATGHDYGNDKCTVCGDVVSDIEISPEVEVDTGEVPEDKAEEVEVVISEIKQELADHVITYKVHEDETEKIQSLTITLESISLTIETTESEDSGTTELTSVVPAKLTYNVEPKDENGAKITEFSEPLTFRLPIPSSVTKDYAKVYHKNSLMGIYEIKGSGNARYVEISSTSFSNYSVELIDFNKRISFEVTFNPNGSEGSMSTQTFTEGEKQTLNANAFTRSNHFFTGWNTAADGSGMGYANEEEITISADITLYAQWSRHSTTPTYTVQYNANGGTGTVYLQVFTSSMTFDLRMNEFVREGYVFAGWNTEADGSGESYAEGQSYSGKKSFTLYAQWKLDVPEFPAVRPEYEIKVDGQTGTITRLNDTSIVYEDMYIRWSIGFDTVDGPFAMIAMLEVEWVEGKEGIVGTFTIPVVQTNGTISGVCYMLTTNENANMLDIAAAAKDSYGMLIK